MIEDGPKQIDECLNCTLPDCLPLNEGCKQKEYSQTPRGKEAARRATKTFRERNPEKVSQWNKEQNRRRREQRTQWA